MAKPFVEKLTLTLVLSLLLANSAVARPASSEMQHMAAEGQFELTPSLSFSRGTLTNNSAISEDNESSETDSIGSVTVLGEYGLCPGLSVGLRLGYQTESITQSGGLGFGAGGPLTAPLKAAGLLDPSFYLKAKTHLGIGSLWYGFNFSASIYNSISTGFQTANVASGGVTATPFLGYESPVGGAILGARVAYDAYQSPRVIQSDNSTGSAARLTGGNVFSAVAYAEMPLWSGTWGLTGGITQNTTTRYSDSVTPSTDQQDALVLPLGFVYASYLVAPDTTFLPTVGYGPAIAYGPTSGYGSLPYDNLDPAGALGLTQFYASLAVRILF